MPQRTDAPGLKWDRRKGARQPYWVASQVVRDPMGYPDKTVRLPREADLETLASLCRDQTASLNAWIAEALKGPPEVTRTPYNGTVLSACRVYQEHPQSRFQKVARNTRKTYVDSLKIIERMVGARLIRNLTIIDIEHWYDEWRKPDAPGEPERVDRAHDAISMFRTVLRFCAALRHPECKLLAEELKMIKFEKGGAREQEMTYQHAVAFIRTALELGQRVVIPKSRALYMAIGVAAQFELLLRQRDIIGQWEPGRPNTKNAIYFDEEMWVGFFVWERFPGWRWRLKTSKSKYRAAAEFDLSQYSILFPLLESVPHAERTGAVVKGEHGLPMRERSYRKWFREIARAAGIPDDVWNMDTRAGGATEAEEAGADMDGSRTPSPTARRKCRFATSAAAASGSRPSPRPGTASAPPWRALSNKVRMKRQKGVRREQKKASKIR